jgi:hypothetical protein
MLRQAVFTGLLGVLFFASCGEGLLPEGFPWNTPRGTGGAPPPHGGAAGAAGMVATSPPGAGAPGAPTCDELAALYVAAVDEDKRCDPTSAEPQCQLRVIPALCTRSCPSLYVNTNAASTAARLRWDMVRCPIPTNCNTTCAPVTSAGHCVADPRLGGRCSDVPSP